MINAEVGMENISQSSGIAFTADFLLSLFRTEEDRIHGMIMGRILKNRLGGQVGKTVAFTLNESNLTLEDTQPRNDDDDANDGITNIIASAVGMRQSIVNSSNNASEDNDTFEQL